MRAGVLGRNVSGKGSVADGRINKRSGPGYDAGKAVSARDATLLVGIGLRRVAVARVAGGFRFHLRAAIGLLRFRNERLPGDGGECHRGAERETGKKPEYSSHGPMIPIMPFGFNLD